MYQEKSTFWSVNREEKETENIETIDFLPVHSVCAESVLKKVFNSSQIGVGLKLFSTETVRFFWIFAFLNQE